MFTRRLNPIQNCPGCGRKSRANPHTESDGVCTLCYELCSIENTVFDSGLEEGVRLYGAEAVRLHKEIVAKGGTPSYGNELGTWVLAQIAQEPVKAPRAPRTGGRTGPATNLVKSVCGEYGYGQHQARRILRKAGLAAPYTNEKKVRSVLTKSRTLLESIALIQK